MRNQLPPGGPNVRETAIVNLDDRNGNGTHWVAYRKINDEVEYFNSFGDLIPPKDLLSYWNVANIKYNYHRYQDFNSVNCGHLCLQFLAGAI